MKFQTLPLASVFWGKDLVLCSIWLLNNLCRLGKVDGIINPFEIVWVSWTFSIDPIGPVPLSPLCSVEAGLCGLLPGVLGLAIGRHQQESRRWGFLSPTSLWAPPLL